MNKVMVILVSVREGRVGDKVANYVKDLLLQDTNNEVDFVDLKDLPLGFFNEAFSPAYREKMGMNYKNQEAVKWGERVGKANSFVVVTPEYNHTLPARMVSAFEWIFQEWVGKNLVAVSYSVGENAGKRAVIGMLPILEELKLNLVSEVNIPSINNGNYEEVLKSNTDNIKRALSILS